MRNGTNRRGLEGGASLPWLNHNDLIGSDDPVGQLLDAPDRPAASLLGGELLDDIAAGER
jgi:hypothetical protein